MGLQDTITQNCHRPVTLNRAKLKGYVSVYTYTNTDKLYTHASFLLVLTVTARAHYLR